MFYFLFCLLTFQNLPPVQIVQAFPVPDAVLAEGMPPATSGNTLWLHLTPREGLDSQWFNVRIAGIEAPNAAGNLTAQLAQDSALALNSIVENQFVEVSCSRSELVTEWDANLRRYLERPRFVCALRLQWPMQNGSFIAAKPSDVALEMLRRGRAWLRELTWQDEVSDGDELSYYTAQSEARLYGRGLWLWAGDGWPFTRVERAPSTRQMPTRKP
jgi:endonuclease YncB( thermonuclease family)